MPLLIIVMVQQYSLFTERIRPEPIEIIEEAATGRYALRVITTFDCQGNDFGAAALSVQFRDQTLLKEPGPIHAGQIVQIHDLENVKIGYNEFLVQFCPVEPESNGLSDAFRLDTVTRPTEDATQEADSPSLSSGERTISRAAKIEVWCDNRVVGRELVWAEQSGPFSKLVRIEVAR